MSWPIVLGSLSYTVMQFVDQVMVAWLSKDALAAVSPAGLWTFTFATFYLGMVSCVTTFASQSIGRGRPEDCGSYAWQGLHMSLFSGVLVLGLWPLADEFFATMGHSPTVTELEVVYFRLRLLGFVFMGWQTVLTAFFQAIGRPSIPMWAGVVANVINIGLDYVLIFGKLGFPAMGVAGAAIATVVSQGGQAALLHAAFIAKPVDREYVTRRGVRLDWVKVGELFRIGWPAGITWFMDIFNWGIFTSYIVGRFGDTQLAAHNVAMNFMQLSFMPVVGLHHAITPIVGQYIGRGDIPRAKGRAFIAMKLAMGYMFTVGLIMAVAGKPLTRIFFTDAPDVVQLGQYLLILAAAFQAFDAVNIIMSGALRGAGDTRWMAAATFFGAYAACLPLAAFFAYYVGWGAVGAWVGATVYIIGLSGFLFTRFYSERWRHIRIFARDRALASTE
jgi:MATE family multidrug resistance protein